MSGCEWASSEEEVSREVKELRLDPAMVESTSLKSVSVCWSQGCKNSEFHLGGGLISGPYFKNTTLCRFY